MTNNRLNIGIFTCHIDNDYAIEVCKGAEFAAKELDCNLIVFPGMFLNASFNDPANQLYDYQYNSIFYYAHPECLDALIISVGAISSFLSEKDLKSFFSHFEGIPILTLEEKVDGYPCIMTDNSGGMRTAVEHLILKHNKKHICFVAGKEGNSDSDQRLGIYLSVLAEHGYKVTDNMVVHGDFSEYCGSQIGTLIDNNPDMDAIIFANDQMAIAGYAELKKRGLRIGEDLSVIGFDDSTSSVNMDPPLTTVNINSCELGYRAIYSAADLAKAGTAASKTLNSRFIKRLSCGCRLCREKDITSPQTELLSLSESEIVDILDTALFDEIRESFFSHRVIESFNDIFADTIKVLKSDDPDPYLQRNIIDKIKNRLESDITDFYPVQKITYMFREMASIFSSCSMSPARRLEFNNLNAAITNALSLFISSSLYSQMQENKMLGWSSIYITRDTLTYGDDLDRTYSSILKKLKALNYNGAYILSLIHI